MHVNCLYIVTFMNYSTKVILTLIFAKKHSTIHNAFLIFARQSFANGSKSSGPIIRMLSSLFFFVAKNHIWISKSHNLVFHSVCCTPLFPHFFFTRNPLKAAKLSASSEHFFVIFNIILCIASYII